MNQHEKTQFMDEEIMGLWPDWTPTGAETAAWMGLLSRYDYNMARTALQQHWRSDKAAARKPRQNDFRAKLNVLLNNSDSEIRHKEPVLLYELKRTDKPEVRPRKFYASKAGFVEHDRLAQGSEYRRKRFEQIYGGRWVVVRYWDNPPAPEPESTGPIGREAKVLAEAKILAGPDTPGKRFLQRLTAARKEAKARPEAADLPEEEPLRISETVEEFIDDLPF